MSPDAGYAHALRGNYYSRMATHEAVGSEELSRLLWSAGKCFADGASAFVIKHGSLSEPARSAYSQAGRLYWVSLSNTYPTTAKYILSFNLVIWIVLLALALVLAYHLPWAVLQAWSLVSSGLSMRDDAFSKFWHGEHMATFDPLFLFLVLRLLSQLWTRFWHGDSDDDA